MKAEPLSVGVDPIWHVRSRNNFKKPIMARKAMFSQKDEKLHRRLGIMTDESRKHWGPNIRRLIWSAQGEQCFYCASPLETWTGKHMHLDHVDPLGRQGDDVLTNLVAACIGCNLEKSASRFPELLAAFDGKLPGAIVAQQIAEISTEQTSYQFPEPLNYRRQFLNRLEPNDRNKLKSDKPLDFYEHPAIVNCVEQCKKRPMYSELWMQGLQLALCKTWEICGRPYYNVYPVVVEPLGRTSLAASVGQVVGGMAQGNWSLAACFATGHEPQVGESRIKSMQISLELNDDVPGGGVLWILAHTLPENVNSLKLYHLDLTQRLDSDVLMLNDVDKDEYYQTSARLAAGIILLAQDARFVERVLLASDRDRSLTDEETEHAFQRAISRTGKTGFTIGRDWIAGPHVRRPHFAIRWTGKGRTIPKLVPVKGSLVRRSDLLEVPTGFVKYGDEGLSGSPLV